MIKTEIRLILFFAVKSEETLYSQRKQDLELSVAQVMSSYDYTGEVMNGFKGLDMVDRPPEELWMEAHNTVWEAVTKTIPKKKKCKKAE